MIKRMAIMLIVVGIVLGGIFGFQAFKARMIAKVMASQGAPAQTVSTIAATVQEWQPRLEAVGSLRAAKGADLSFEVPGVVAAIHFESGEDVEAGALLLELRAEADVAHLHSLQAMADLARITYERDKKQLAIRAVSQATVDTDEASLRNARAQVAEQQAVIDKKRLRAPFAGRLGLRAVDLGQYLSPGTTIVTLQSLDPIYVDFYLPQQALSRIRVGQSVTARIDTYPEETFRGEISAISPKVDKSTRNLQVRVTLANPERKLLPGMYATVDIETGAPKRYVTLPQTAITYNSYGNSIYLVDRMGKGTDGQPQLVAHQAFVTTGATRGDQVAVLSGVAEGDIVVTAGQMKLQNGTPLKIDNSVTPTNDPHPTPDDR